MLALLSFGTSDPAKGVPIDCLMPFEAGSNTKMMTAMVLLQLQEEGKLKLDDRLSVHLPAIAARLPSGEIITPRQLANQSSGVFSYSDNAPDGTPGLIEGGLTDPVARKRPVSPQEMVDFAVAHRKLDFPPGLTGKWHCSRLCPARHDHRADRGQAARKVV